MMETAQLGIHSAREQKWNAEGCRLKLIFSIVRSAAAGTAPAFFK